MKKYPLSVVTLTKNSSDKIIDCLESVAWCDDIVIVDDFSKDNTLELAKKYTDNICQRKFLSAEGSLLRMVWMPKMLKEEIGDRVNARAKELGVPNLMNMIADETVGSTEEEILPFLQEKGHPALTMDSILG